MSEARRALPLLWRPGPPALRNLLANPARVVYSATVKFLRGTLRNFSLGLAFRRMLKSLDKVETRLAEQNAYLKRLADHFAPEFDTTQAPTINGVDFLNTQEAGLVLDYIDKTQRDTGKPPSDEEILRYLHDEASVSESR